MTVAVLGAGSWGTTLANLLAHKGVPIQLWAYEPEVVESINARHVNELYLPDSPLHSGITALSDAAEVVAGAEAVVAVTPSHAARSAQLLMRRSSMWSLITLPRNFSLISFRFVSSSPHFNKQ